MTVAGLSVALQYAIAIAVLPHSLHVDDPSPVGRLDALTKQMLGQTKNLSATGASETEEATGLALAIQLIESITADIRSKI